MSKVISLSPFPNAPGIIAAVVAKTQDRRSTLRAMQLAGVGDPARRNDLAPEITLESRKISDLRPASRQVRRFNASHTGELIASLEPFGICAPVVVTDNGEIVEQRRRGGLVRYLPRASGGPRLQHYDGRGLGYPDGSLDRDGLYGDGDERGRLDDVLFAMACPRV